MFNDTFAAELARRIGSFVEIATDNNMEEGILTAVTPELVLVVDVTNGYDNTRLYISLEAINFMRFSAAVV